MGCFLVLGYVFPTGLKTLIWTGLGLGLIKIKQNNVDWAWALLRLNKRKKKGDRMDSVGSKPVTIIYN